ncbi:MAG: branched-chain amino acid ABC transporter permease [Deltaproteobacteria bacterium]|nr:branched-chain amino acid ABC transporter permease [Deltaproteobacteria bacterium]
MKKLGKIFSSVPMTGWLFGVLAATIVEYLFGDPVSYILYMEKLPALFGTMIILKNPLMIPSVLVYDLVIYVIPAMAIARLTAPFANRLAEKFDTMPTWISVGLHLILFYAIMHIWSGVNDYRALVLKLTMIAVILTLSLNIINGYQGEFSCSHPGFMAIGAYVSSTLTLIFFANDKLFGTALLPPALGPWIFPFILVAGGAVAAISSLVVAIPSFRTRGDYLAIISLAFMFIVKSVIENLEIVGGPRGMSSQPNYSTLPVVFCWMAGCIWIINNFVSSIMGKALNAVRDNEPAADSMTVNTRKTKMISFMFGAFWAGVAGGLFAHVLRYVNPGTFSIQKLAEVLAMVYFGGLNSIYGSIVGAVSISLLGEALRPLELFKWIIIPLILILVMIFRPYGLISFTEFNVVKLLKPRRKQKEQGVE